MSRTVGESFSTTESGLFVPETAEQRHRAKIKRHIQDSLALLDEVIAESATVGANAELQVSIFNAIAANLAD